MKPKLIKWSGRLLAAGLVLVVVLFGAGCIYNVAASRRLAREIAETPRDPETGFVEGITPLDLSRGERKGVLLLHGFIGSPRDFGELPHELAAAGYRVSAPLLPGHGTRPTDMETVGADQLAEAVSRAYTDLRRQCDAVAVVGFSMGGTLAVRLVRDTQAPPPEALVLASPYFGVTYRWYAVLTPETWTRVIAPFVRYLIKGKTFVMVHRREALQDIYSYQVVPTRAVLALDRLARDVRANPPATLPASTLLIYSTADGASAPGRTREMADRWGLPASSQLVLSRSNHHVFHDHERRTVISKVVEFIAGRL